MRQGTSAQHDKAARSVVRAREQEARKASAYTLKVLIRSSGPDVDEATKTYIRGRIGLKLGKFAESLDRIFIRMIDVNGPRGGEDIVCRIKIVFAGIDGVLYESQAFTVREAFDLAIDRTERLVAKQLERAREHHAPAPAPRRKATPASAAAPAPQATLSPAASGAEVPPTPGPASRTRRTRIMAAATYALEVSTNGQPSRKSTRKSANRAKPDSNLARRNQRKVGSPAERAVRAGTDKP